MRQQINLYPPELRRGPKDFSAVSVLQACAAIAIAMIASYLFAAQHVSNLEAEVAVIVAQETAAIDRLSRLGPVIEAAKGEQNLARRLDDALAMLAEKQAILTLMQGSSLGDTRGFSRSLEALARQQLDGVWLTRIRLAAGEGQTTLAGHAIRPELVPAYVKRLANESPFAGQRFQQFQIDRPADQEAPTVAFSMHGAETPPSQLAAKR